MNHNLLVFEILYHISSLSEGAEKLNCTTSLMKHLGGTEHMCSCSPGRLTHPVPSMDGRYSPALEKVTNTTTLNLKCLFPGLLYSFVFMYKVFVTVQGAL